MTSTISLKLRRQILSHSHNWIPIQIAWFGSGPYSMEQACACGAFRWIDAMEIKNPFNMCGTQHKVSGACCGHAEDATCHKLRDESL